MLRDWKSYARNAPVEFERHDNILIITNDEPTSQGLWYAWWGLPVAPGQKFQLLGTHNGGKVKALFFRSSEDYLFNVSIEPGETFEIPAEVAVLRIDCRLWNEQGKALFDGINIIEYAEPEETEAPALPIPEPIILEERHLVGYKWGRNLFVMDTAEDLSMIPPDRGEAYEVQGVQHGRSINLQVGNIITAEPDEEEE